jgi:1-acyl-sn-glycerol-3-phosphate acyltransferase
MIRVISKIILKMTGWKIELGMPSGTEKAVLLVAPHTSNLDFFIGRIVFNVLHLKVKFLIKKEVFKWPFGGLLKRMGGIPVDRGRSSNLVGNLAEEFRKKEKLMLVITPEATRKYTKSWKKGFYYIATEAKVPIALGFLDYKNKTAGIKSLFYPTGDLQKDFESIKSHYGNLNARYPEKYCKNPIIK